MINCKTNKREAAMRGLKVLTLIFVLAAAAPAAAVPQIMTDYGDQMGWRSADINAMAGTGAAYYRGGMSNIFNPAFLAKEKSWQFDAGISLDQEHEDRFVPLYDTFDNVVADMSIASNRDHYWQSGFGLAFSPFDVGLPLAFGLSLADRYSYSYTFNEEVRDPDPFGGVEDPRDTILQERERKVTGTLRNLSLGAGADLMDIVSIGAAVHYAFGTRIETHSVRDYEDANDSYRDEDEFDMNGVNLTLGARVMVTERVEFGLAYESPLTAKGDRVESSVQGGLETTVTTPDDYYRYPRIFRGGVTFFPRTDPKTVFTAEMEYIPWEELEDSRVTGLDNPQNLKNTTDVRIGLQHTFYNGVPIRFGFRHFENYRDPDAGSTIFTGGTGIPFGSGMFAVSVELGKITSYQEHQFPYPPDYASEDIARVEDTRFRIGLGYTVNW